jgi:hypothetical protein
MHALLLCFALAQGTDDTQDDDPIDVDPVVHRAGPAPYLAFEWRPLSRGDLTIVQEQRTSGLLVSSADGFARPQVQLDVGAWLSENVALQGSVGVARATVTTWTGNVYAQQHWGVVRPGVDLKLRPSRRPAGLPIPWALIGGHVDIPSARDVSNAYTVEEQLDADDSAGIDRLRLGALGARAGVGVEQRLIGGLSLGAQYAAQWQRSLFVRNDPVTIESQLVGEASILLLFDWPRHAPATPSPGTSEVPAAASERDDT